MSVQVKDHASTSNGDASAGGLTNHEKAVVGGLLSQDASKGAAVHAFDPDADPARKASLAGSGVARAQLDALPKLGRKKAEAEVAGGLALGIDTSGVGGAAAPVPTVTITDVDKASRVEGQIPGADAVPGSIPTGTAPSVPPWMQTGWRQVAGIDPSVAMDPQKQADAGVLADFLSEQMYGGWYHNAGIILFAVLATRFVTAVGLGFAWILIILAFCTAYYSLSITRTRNRARDDIQRELVKTRLVTETESADWLNGFLDRFWLIYEPVLSQTIVASVDAVLASSTPAFLESIRMTTFTLGTKAPRIDYVRTFPKTPEDIVIMDWALSFTPNDLMDITPRQAQKRVNPKIVLSIRLGKGGISKSLPILLEDMEFTGKMRIKLKLMTNFPHIKAIDMSFIEKPTFDYVLKPLGGDTFGFDINNIPGLAPFIRDQVHANLGPMMYDPNVFTIDLESLLSGTPLDAAIGVLKVTISGARGLKAVKFGGGQPDPYVTIALGAKPPVCKTKTVMSTSNPSWRDDTQFILVNSLAEILNLSLWDYNEHRADNQLGTVSQDLSILQEDAEREDLEGKIILGGKDRGDLKYDLSFYPVMQPTKNADGTHDPPPDSPTGIVRLTLHQAKDLPTGNNNDRHAHINPFARVLLGASKTPVHKTPVLKRQNQPIWESHCEFLVPQKHQSVITVEIVDSKDFASDPILGTVTVKLADLLELKERGQDWLPLRYGQGKIRLTAEWKPVAMTGSVFGAAAYVPPIGILRIWLKSATDVKNVEAALGGKSDPYVRVLGRNSKILARTEVQNNNLNPEWDQIVYVPVHNLREDLILELMDYQNIGKDRSLGYVELKVSDCAELAPESEAAHSEYPYVSKGHQIRNDRIKLDKANTHKGTLSYEVDFKSAMSIRGGVSFEAEKNEIMLAAEAKRTAMSASASGSGNESEASGSGAKVKRAGSIARAGSIVGNRSIRTLKTQSSRASLVPGSAAAPLPAPQVGDANAAIQELASTTTAVPDRRDGIHESKEGGEPTAVENPEEGVALPREELLTYQSGVLVFQLISGNLSHKGSVEVMFDDGYWPSFTSTRARGKHQKWDQIGEGFVRELDFSRIWIRINAADDDSEKEEVIAEYKTDTRAFLEHCLGGAASIRLEAPDGSDACTLVLSARYVPVDIKLEPRESINNMGVLRCDVLRAKNLLAVDRGGKSDPNVTFSLNGMKVFKSETKKKTLNPEWDESFEVMVPSRVAAKFEFEINDWDRLGTADHLGAGRVDLASLEPFESTEVTLPVIHEKKGEHGSLTIRMMFQPEIIARTRHKTSTFSTAGRAITQVGGLPIAAGKGVIHGGGAVAMGVGRGVGTVGGFAGRKIGLIKRKDKAGKEVLVPSDDAAATNITEGFIEAIPAVDSNGADLRSRENGEQVESGLGRVTPPGLGETDGSPARRHSEQGTLVVSVLGASDVKSDEGAKLKSYVAVKMGGKSHKTDHVKGTDPEWNEHFTFHVQPGSSTISVALHEHHSFGRDPVIGEADLDIWHHLSASAHSADPAVQLSNGTGTLRLHLEWTAGGSGSDKAAFTGGGLLSRKRSVSSAMNADAVASSPGRLSGLRMSMARRDKDKERDGE